MTKKKKLQEYTLYGDLDGMTVGELEKLLTAYTHRAKIKVKTEYFPHFDGRVTQMEQRDYFVIEEPEDD